jgi:hypothetical protein
LVLFVLFGMFWRARTPARVVSMHHAFTTVVALVAFVFVSVQGRTEFGRTEDACRGGALIVMFAALSSLCWLLMDAVYQREAVENILRGGNLHAASYRRASPIFSPGHMAATTTTTGAGGRVAR